jgi:hypothetical protein
MATFNVVTDQEKRAILDQLCLARENNASEEEISALQYQLPLPACLAKTLKQLRGLDRLLNSNFNLSEVVEEYGTDFLKD